VTAALTAAALGAGALAGCGEAASPELAPAPSSSPRPEMSPEIGVQFHGMWSSYTDQEREEVLDRFAEAGALWVRLDVSWAMLQPDGPEEFDHDWGVPFVDRVLDMITSRGLRPLVTLWMTPEWANDEAGERALPDDPDDYAEAARWAASRWADQVDAWEVWNEPNSDVFLDGADPAGYARLLQAAYPALKEGDPSATVVFGGTEHNDVAWIAEVYEAGAQGSFDAMATHPYSVPADLPPDASTDDAEQSFRDLTAVRELMAEHGDDDLPVWLTELGWRTRENTGDEPAWMRGVTPEQQAEHLRRTIDLVREETPYVTHLFWYADIDRSDGDEHLHGFGVLDEDLQPKPVFDELARYWSGRS
jgi:polysaccharide biosynthesis protein PslG